jgi:hypothetical protein
MTELSPAGQASNQAHLINRLDKELNELLKAVHEYRFTHKDNLDELLIARIIAHVNQGKLIVQEAK